MLLRGERTAWTLSGVITPPCGGTEYEGGLIRPHAATEFITRMDCAE